MYRKKYLKYKTKYLELKQNNMKGGSDDRHLERTVRHPDGTIISPATAVPAEVAAAVPAEVPAAAVAVPAEVAAEAADTDWMGMSMDSRHPIDRITNASNINIYSFNAEGFKDANIYKYINSNLENFNVLCLQEIVLKESISTWTLDNQKDYISIPGFKIPTAIDTNISPILMGHPNYKFIYDGFTGGIIFNSERFNLKESVFVPRPHYDDTTGPDKMCLILKLVNTIYPHKQIIIANIHLKALPGKAQEDKNKIHKLELKNILNNIIPKLSNDGDKKIPILLCGDFNNESIDSSKKQLIIDSIKLLYKDTGFQYVESDDDDDDDRLKKTTSVDKTQYPTENDIEEICCHGQITQHGDRMAREGKWHTVAAGTASMASKIWGSSTLAGVPFRASLDAIVSIYLDKEKILQYLIYPQSSADHTSDHDLISCVIRL